jgi:hypothetical protein
MKKVLIFFLIFTVTIFSASGCGAQGTIENTKATEIILTINKPTMTINGTEKNIDDEGTAPVIVNNRTLLPVRAAVEAMGGSVEWDENSRTVLLKKNADTIQLTIDSYTALLNNEEQTLDTAPIIINDRTMLPIRFIAESFDFNVEWDEENQQVIITDTKSQEPSQTDTVTNSESPENESSISEQNENQIIIGVNEQKFTVTLEDNETARAFREMLPMTLDMEELNGNEKFYYLDTNLPSDSRRVDQINTGDIMLYGSNCIVAFFRTFKTSYTYTPIGHIDDEEGFAEALSNGRVTITFSKN